MDDKNTPTSPHEGEEHLISKNKYFDVDGPVFWPSAVLIVAFIVVTLAIGAPMNKIFATIQTSISDNGGWFFILSVNLFLFFILFLAFSKYGKIRLGGPEAKPEFSKGGWFAMLFSAGMGIGILFWSVGEPISHFVNPPWANPEQLKLPNMPCKPRFFTGDFMPGAFTRWWVWPWRFLPSIKNFR